MGSPLSITEFKRIKRQHGHKVAEAANRGEYAHLVRQIRTPLTVSGPDFEEVERPARTARPIAEKRPRPIAQRPAPVPIEALPEVPAKETVEPPDPSQPFLNQIQARFVRIAWAVQARRKRPVTQAELEIIRDAIFFGGNFFASMGMLERVDAIVRDDDGTTIRYRVNKPRFPQLQDADDEIVGMAVKRIAAESP